MNVMTTELDNLAFEFFKLFAQYEYALKAMQYGTAGKKGQAEPDWDRFANEIGAAVMTVQDAQVSDARQYIFEHPPKRQVWVNNKVEWEDVPNNEHSPQILFSHIRRVRCGFAKPVCHNAWCLWCWISSKHRKSG